MSKIFPIICAVSHWSWHGTYPDLRTGPSAVYNLPALTGRPRRTKKLLATPETEGRPALRSAVSPPPSLQYSHTAIVPNSNRTSSEINRRKRKGHTLLFFKIFFFHFRKIITLVSSPVKKSNVFARIAPLPGTLRKPFLTLFPPIDCFAVSD